MFAQGFQAAPLLLVLTSLGCAGCSLSPNHLEDPTQILNTGPKVSEVTRSLRCEIITFLVSNKLRAQSRLDAHNAMMEAKLAGNRGLYEKAVVAQKYYTYLPVDASQFAALSIDYKNVDSLSLTLGLDYKRPNLTAPKTAFESANLVDYHAGPSYTDTSTFELIQTIGLPQNADLGPSKNPGPPKRKGQFDPGRFSGVFYDAFAEDGEFYCYRPLGDTDAQDFGEVVANIQSLVDDDARGKAHDNFQRIYVGNTTTTLSGWLQKMSSETAANQLTIYDSKESLINGQLEYTFTLDVKPGMDLKYTLVASLINPLTPEVSGSIEHSSQFALYLNSPYSLPTFGAKTGNSCNPNLDYKTAISINPYNTNCKKPGT